MKSVQICEGCGEEFIGSGLFCLDCGCVKIRIIHRVPKFGRETLDPKRDKPNRRINKVQQEMY